VRVFGPVPSRRLGVSLGVDNLPPGKTCSYSCVYCQAGRTSVLTVERLPHSDPAEAASLVSEALEEAGRVDYVTFVPDGEPTLDSNLGETARAIGRECGVRLAVLTNSSLAWREDVRRDLGEFDLVSAKVDSALEGTWRRVNRPHPALSLGEILEGLRRLSSELPGTLVTETMLVSGLNSSRGDAEALADLLADLDPERAYLSAPIRPPAEPWVSPPTEEEVLTFFKVLESRLGPRVELLMSPEGPGFVPRGEPASYVLSVVEVHPMRLEYAREVLRRMGADPDAVVSELVSSGEVAVVEHGGAEFLVRRVRR